MEKPIRYTIDKPKAMTLDLAKKQALAESKAQPRKVIFINVDSEGAFDLSSIPDKTASVHQYKGGAEVPLNFENKKPSDEVKVEKPMSTTKTKAKSKAVKKEAAKPAKVAAKKETADEFLTAPTIEKGISDFIKTETRQAVLKVLGKVIGIKLATTFNLSKNIMAKGRDGIIMVFPALKGYYHFPASSYKTVFGKIMASGTWKKSGSYGQSTFPESWNEFWKDLK